MIRPIAFLLALLVSAPSFAAFTPANLDEENGCGKGKAAELAAGLCSDYDAGSMSLRDTMVDAAKSRCVNFYQTALRVQNVFCSYQKDADSPAAATPAAAEIVKAYMARISALGLQFRTDFTNYLVSLGQLNGAAGNDELNEALCSASQVRSEVPGYLRELLVSVSWAAAQVTYTSMWKAVRDNYGKLRGMKEEADRNPGFTGVKDLTNGQVLQHEIAKEVPPDDTIKLPDGAPAVNGLVQFFAQKFLEKAAPKLAEGAGIVGCGGLIVYEVASGQDIKYPETAACLVSAMVPEVGLAANILIMRARRSVEVLHTYLDFARGELYGADGANLGIKTTELIRRWGKRTKQDFCIANANAEDVCVEKRKTMKPYEHNSCSLSPIMDSRTSPFAR